MLLKPSVLISKTLSPVLMIKLPDSKLLVLTLQLNLTNVKQDALNSKLLYMPQKPSALISNKLLLLSMIKLPDSKLLVLT